MSELANRTAIVTGSGRNLGRAIAIALAQGGANVMINTCSNAVEAAAAAEAVRACGATSAFFLADVSDPAAVQALVDATVREFGGVDILVNNVGLRRQVHFSEISFSDWKRVMAVNVDSAFLCTQACLPHLKKSPQASIVNIGGIGGHAGVRNRAHVVTSKAALAGFTKALALDLAEYGITVNNVAPARLDTPESHSAAPRRHAVIPPVGREGKPEEAAAMVRFLCGPDARYMTGQTLHVNGGLWMA